MTPAEVDAFLRRHHTMALATHGPGGFPHVVAMSYGFLDDRLAFWGDRRSQKIVNLQRDGRLGCLVDDGDEHGELRGVHLAGVAEFVGDPDQLAALGRAVLAQRFGPDADPARFPVPLDRLVAGRVGVRIRVERTASWDHRQRP
ncbi:MAG TPA: pyridoxamine 5'-phosphate oxidase family protein [Acidimicrobiia bacterium]|nr:pyridoxamine 5'-phosphate oxidase family protein [Acidimicrobiia bacterium]